MLHTHNSSWCPPTTTGAVADAVQCWLLAWLRLRLLRCAISAEGATNRATAECQEKRLLGAPQMLQETQTKMHWEAMCRQLAQKKKVPNLS